MGEYNKRIIGRNLIKQLEGLAPLNYAVDKDPIGLQLGDINATVEGVLVTLDVTSEVVQEAIELGANWIIAHHPLIFNSLTSIKSDQPDGKLIKQILTNDINVYVMHTNLDSAHGGVNDVLSDMLGLKDTKVLLPTHEELLKKLVVYVPINFKDRLLYALSDSYAGVIGNYSHCTFGVHGEGTFMPLEGTNPFIGQKGKLEKVKEVRLETIFPESKKNDVVKAMLKAHPYEEVAYDIYPLDLDPITIGLGRVGVLDKQIKVEELIDKVKSVFKLDGLMVATKNNKQVKSVAVLGGSGGKYIDLAKKFGADAYITGDVTYHQAQRARDIDLSLLDAGHYIEHFVVDNVREFIREKNMNLKVYSSTVNTNPFVLY